MTEREDSPHSTSILQATLTKEAIICYLRVLGIRSHMSYCASLFPTATKRGKQKSQKRETQELEHTVFCLIFSLSHGQRNEGLLTLVSN